MSEQFQKTDDSDRFRFYETDGLRFECRRCSGCCRYSPGFVFLSHEDLSRLSAATGLDFHGLFTTYLRIVPIGLFSRLSLQEKPNYDCIFWEADGCRIYEHRPLQCRSFPFWGSVLSSRRNWEEQKNTCPGIDGGKTHTPEEIDMWLARRGRERLIEVESNDPDVLAAEYRRYLESRARELPGGDGV